jgi:DNA-binding beta-propeller fold protein YncE
MRRIAASVAIALLGALLAAGPASASSVYVVNLNDGSVSQYGADAAGALSPLSPAVVPAGPGHSIGIAITPDGRSVYVANGASISQYDIGPGGALTAKSPASVSTPPGAEGVAVSPDGKSVYVGVSGSNVVSQFDVGPGGALVPKAPPTVPNPGNPDYVAVSPDGKSVYVGDGGNEAVSQYDVGAGGVLTPKSPATVPVGELPQGIAVSPDGKSLYVAIYGTGEISQFDIGAGGLLSPKSPATVAVGEYPEGIAISPDGRSAYLANESGFVNQYDVGPGGSLTPKAAPTVPSGPTAGWVAVSPSGRSVYTADFGTGTSGGAVSQYDADAGGALFAKSPASLAAGNGPVNLAVTPDQPPAASLTVPAGRVRPGVPAALNASGSSDPDGSIARYDWSFGDGQSAPNGGAAPTHSYAKPGRYLVSVDVTDNEGCSTALLFTGQTAFCSGSPSASQTQPVEVAYPTVRVRCPAKARPKDCRFKLQAVTKKRKGKAESAIAKFRAKAGRTTLVPLKPKAKFRSKLAAAASVLIREAVTINGSARTSYRKLKIVG